jgi:hypothetical protein
VAIVFALDVYVDILPALRNAVKSRGVAHHDAMHTCGPCLRLYAPCAKLAQDSIRGFRRSGTLIEEPSVKEEEGKEEQARGSRLSLWGSLGFYVLGVVTGVLLFALITMLNSNGIAGLGRNVASLDAPAIRSAARDGTLDAIATLQAQSAEPPTPAVTPTSVPKTAFTVRDANRLGSKDAPVMFVEFSDFQ